MNEITPFRPFSHFSKYIYFIYIGSKIRNNNETRNFADFGFYITISRCSPFPPFRHFSKYEICEKLEYFHYLNMLQKTK